MFWALDVKYLWVFYKCPQCRGHKGTYFTEKLFMENVLFSSVFLSICSGKPFILRKRQGDSVRKTGFDFIIFFTQFLICITFMGSANPISWEKVT